MTDISLQSELSSLPRAHPKSLPNFNSVLSSCVINRKKLIIKWSRRLYILYTSVSICCWRSASRALWWSSLITKIMEACSSLVRKDLALKSSRLLSYALSFDDNWSLNRCWICLVSSWAFARSDWRWSFSVYSTARSKSNRVANTSNMSHMNSSIWDTLLGEHWI